MCEDLAMSRQQILAFFACSGGSRGGSRGAKEPPFGLNLVPTTTDDRLGGTPLWPENCFCGSP